MSNAKPIVVVATACDNVLLEKDGTISIIRVVDKFMLHVKATVKGDGDTAAKAIEGIEVAVPIKAIVMLKSGDYTGEGELSLKVHLPDGTRKDFPEKWTFLLEGGEKGVNVNLQFGLSSKHVGLSWIEVYWNGEILSKFPVTLVREGEQEQASEMRQ